MKPTKTLRIKLLLVGAFLAFAQFSFGQSISVQHYENGMLISPSFFTNNAPRLCANDSVKLTAVGFTGTLSWSGPNGSIASTATTIWVHDQGSYSVTDQTNSASTSVGKDNANPEIYSNDYPFTISTNGGVGSTSNASSPSGGLFGILSANQEYLAPFGAEYAYNKQQYLYKSTELQSMGMNGGSTVKQIGFYLNSAWNGNCNTNLQIRVYQTANTSLSAFETSSSNHLGSWDCDLNYQSGWNYFDINDFNWNGTDNLVFEFCYYSWGGNGPQNPSIAVDNVGYNASVVIANPSNDQCGASGGFVVANYRPSTAFKYSSAPLKDTIVLCGTSTTLRLTDNAANYTWSSANSTYSGSTNTLNVSSQDLVYITGYTNQFCKYNDTVQIYSAAQAVPTITASSTDFCEGGSETLSTTLSSDQTARWSTGATGNQITISEGGTYTVTVSNEFGCSKSSSGKVITEIAKPAIFKDAQGPIIATNTSHHVSSTGGYVNSFGPVHHLFDYNGEKYFATKYNVDSTTYVNVLANNDLAEIAVIDNGAIDAVFQQAHKAKYLKDNNKYPFTVKVGARWDNTAQQPNWYNGSTSTYENIESWTTLDANQDGKHFVHYQHADDYWSLGYYWTTGAVMVKYNTADYELSSTGEIFCDSVQLFAPPYFDDYLWSTGETTESIWVSGNGSHTVSLTGTYTKSDGTTCSLTSDNYTFTINDAPALSITNLSGTSDLTGSNHIELEADYTSGASIQWSTGSTNDSIHVYSIGEYTATATLNGCSVSKSFTAYQPIYVDATDGDDANGTGTLSDPYKTINKGITESQSRGKIYVLPGTYNETLDITKNVFIASDYYRVGNANAVNTTIINGQGLRRLVNYDNTTEPLDSAVSKIVGFTMRGGFQDSDEGAGIYGGWNVTGNTQIKNSIIEQTSRKCCANGIVLSWFNSGEIILDSVYVDDIGNSGDGDQRISFAIPYGKLTILNSRISNVLQDNSLFNISNSAELYVENTHITGISDRNNSNGVVLYLNNSAKAYFNHVTIDDIDLSDDRYVFRIGSGSYSTLHFVNSVVDETYGRFIMDQSSSNATIEIVNSVVGNAESGYSGSYSSNTPALTSIGKLQDYSGAIGLARSPVNVGGKIYTSPLMDLSGTVRPNPTGSNPDAGAYENAKAQGDFAALIGSCGYLISAQVFNSDNYTVQWIQNGTVLGTDDNYLASSKGTYTLKVYSVDRLDTITKTVTLNNPLSSTINSIGNVCSAVSSNSGYLNFGPVNGGTPNNIGYWSYWAVLQSENGSELQSWDMSNSWVATKDNLAEGTYYLKIKDGTSCEIVDTIQIDSQDQETYYVSTTGDDSNSGLSENDAFASISRAISSTCDRDTVLILDGHYFEDSIFVPGQIIIGSKYLLDGDTSHIHNTVLDGDNRNFIFHYSTNNQGGGNWADTAYSKLVGFTIQNSSTNLNERAGVSVMNERELSIESMRFLNNSSSTGGAVWTQDWSRVSIKGCYFEENEATSGDGGAVLFRDNAYASIANSKFVNNTALQSGGGISFNGVRELLAFDNCTFIGNQSTQNNAGSVYIGLWNSQSEVEVNNLIVKETKSGYAPVFVRSSGGYWVRFNNALIVNNYSSEVSAIEVRDGSTKVALVNSTIANNTTTSTNSSMIGSSWGSISTFVFNSILQKAGEQYVFNKNSCDNVSVSIKNSFVTDGSNYYYDNACGNSSFAYEATSCLSAGLYFADASNGDFSISSVASVLGAGAATTTFSNKTFSAPATDLLGNTRPSPTGTSPDLGAIESIESAPQLGMTSVVEHNGFCETNSGSITVNLLNYSGAASYQWKSLTDANWSWNSTQTASNLADGTYRAIASDNSTQAKLDSIDVTIVTLPSITISNLSSNANCNGDSDGELAFAIEGGNPFGTSQYTYSITFLETESAADGYVWNDGSYYFSSNSNSSPRSNTFSSNNWAEDFRNGYYEVVVTDEDGCSVTDTLLLDFDHELPAVNITTLSSDGVAGLTSMCSGVGNTIDLTANVVGGGGTNSYAWSNSSTAQTVGIAQTGSYEIEVSDQYGCVGRDTMDITFQVAPQVYVGAPATKTGEPIADFVYLGEYEDHHYYYYTLTHNYNWSQAKTVAESMGAYLWSVNSRAEHEAVAQMYQSQNQVCCEAFIGAYKEGGVWKWHSGEPFTFTNWAQNEPSSPNYDTRIRIQWGWWDSQGVPGQWEDYGTEWDQQKYIFEFPSNQEFLAYSESFCDSITLFAGTPDGAEFTAYYWVDVNGDTVGIGQSFLATDDIELSVQGEFTRSDGQSCSLTSSNYSVQINASPNLVVDAISGTYDYTAGDTLYFAASSDSSGATITWSETTSSDTLEVTSVGTYTATASMNGCEVSETFRVEEALYVAKTGNDATGDGSLTNPYKTIQHGIDMAESGGKIYVLPGSYNENLVVDKQVRLFSDFVRLGNANAKNTTIINAGFNGRAIEFSNTTRIDRDSTKIEGFTIKNGDTGSNEGSGVYASGNPGTGLTIENCVISNHRKTCCSDGIAIAIHGVDLYFTNVDIIDNGSVLYWDERSTVTLRYLDAYWDNVTFRGNEANASLIYIHESDLVITNSDFIGNTIHDNNEALMLVDWGSNLVLNHVTMTNTLGQGYAIKFGNNQDQDVVIYNSVIDGFAQGGIKTQGSSNNVHVLNSVVNSIPQAISGNGNISRANAIEISSLELNLNGTLKSTSPAIGLGGSDTTVAGYDLVSPAMDLAGNMRPNPSGSMPDAGAYENVLARGAFGLQVSNCGYAISAKVVNSDAYSISISSTNGFSSNDEDVVVSLKGTYTIEAYDSLTATTLTETVSITNPLSIGYLFSRDACAANGGYGEIVVGDLFGGTAYNIPNNNWFDYYIDIYDSTGSNVVNWQVQEGEYNTWNTSISAGVYTIALSDAAGCTVFDTVEVEDLEGSKYYISTTGSDTASGLYNAPLATITEAINRACDGDTIILLDGEYFENIDIQSNSPYVTIASEMILDGQSSHIGATKVNGMDEDPVFNISQKNSTNDTTNFYGFTITNGKASNWYGGGGISSYYSNIALRHMVVTGNRSGQSGGGIGMDGGELNLWNTVISNNLAQGQGGGIRANYMYRIDGHGSTIIENNKSNQQGGGISFGHGHWQSSEEFYIRGFEVTNNSSYYHGGGVYIDNWGQNNTELIVEDLWITHNRSIYSNTGGLFIANNGDDAVLQNCIIAYNRSNNTGGLGIENVDLTVNHVTIYKNKTLDGTSANDQIMMQNNANVLFLNSAVGGQENIGSSVAHTFYFNDWDTTCDLTVANSIISGGTSSMDNPYASAITGTPIGQALYLMDPANGNYMLSPVSQGLGAGTSSYTGVTMPAVDINGVSRPNPSGTDPDVGAVESPLDSEEFGAAYEVRNNIACDETYGQLKVIPLNGTGAYKFELDDLTGTATFVDQQNVSSYTYSSLYSGDYLVTITDIGATPNVVFTDTVSVTGKDSLSLVKDVVNEFCFGESNGSISLSVSGGDGYYDYTWTTATNSNFPKTSALNNLGPEEYFVTVKDGDNCFVQDSVTIITLHSLPVVSITGNINKGGTITSTTNPQIRACAGDEVTLDAGSGFVTYNWTTVDGLNSWTTQTLPASYEQGFYVTAVDSFGCSNTDSAEVFYVQTPAIYASNVNTNIGASLQSVTSYVEGTSQRIGDNYNDAKPYGAGDKFAKMQFIIPASELIAEGLTDQTTINSIGFEVEVETGSPVQSFKVKMKNTTANQASTTFETGLTQVYSLNTLTPGEGWNTHVLDNGFVWDGTKNLLVQVEYSNVAFNSASNNILGGADMSYNAAAVATGNSSVIGNTMANFTSTWRPNFKFGIDKVQATDTLRVCDFTMLNTTDDYDTYSWLVNGTSQSSLLRYSVSSPLEVVLKTVDAASSCTMYSDTVQVLLDTTPTVFASATSLLGCIGDTLTVGLDSTASDITYTWSNGVNDSIGVFTQSGEYYVYANSISGCQGVDTVSVDINIPPDVVVELNGRVLTSTDGSLVADNSACDTTLILPYLTTVDTLSVLNSSEWSTYSDEYLVWEFQQGWDSLVDFTGPQYDADSSYTGGFYQFDPASLTDQNKVGYLQLGCVNLLGMGSPELTFDYHMVDVYADSSNTADQMGSLELQVKAAGDDNWSTVWQRSGTEPAYEWVTKSIALSAYVNKTIQLRWKGTAGVGGPRSEMALDNISINDSLALASNIAGRATPETVCEGDSLFAKTVSNGTSNFSYVWSSGDTTAGVELHSTGWYSVKVVDEKNCLVTTDSVYILVNPAPSNVLVVSDTTQYCEGLFDSLMISSPSGYEHYEWFMNTGSGYLSADTTHALQVDSIANGAQQYYVVITDSLGCRSTSVAVELVQTPTPQLTVSGVDVLCNGDSTGTASVDATGSGQWVYNWSNGDTTDTVTDLPTDWYTVTVVDQYSCEATDSIFVGEPNPVSLSITAVSNVDCYGSNTGSIDIDFSGGVGGYLFSWTDSTGALSSGSEDLLNAPAGEYYLSAQDSNGCVLFDTISINEPSELIFSVDSVLDQTCKGFLDGYIGVSATGGTLPYLFNANGTSSTTGQFANLDSNFYLLTVTDSLGCIVTDSAVVSEPPAPYDEEEICVVSVDSTGSNMIVWERTPGVRTASYVILTENASTQYVPAGAQLYADFSTFVDTASNPAVRPYRYKLALIDSCGFISDTSDYHATIHLQASPGVAQNEVQLQWTPYEGKQVQTYYIYRWVDTITRVLVDSVSANVQTYTDIYPVNTTITALLYEIGAKFIVGGCSPSAGKQATYATSMSNRLDWGADGGLPIGTEEWVNVVLESDLGLFPNPTQGYLNVVMSGAWEQEENVQMKVLDITGRVIAQRQVDHGGDVRFDFRELPSGVYFLHTMTERGRIIVKRFERIN